MSVPNVGVTGVIQDPGLGGTIAAGLGDIAKFMVNLENIRAQNQAEQQRIALAKQQQAFVEEQARLQQEAAIAAQRQAMLRDQNVGQGMAVLARGDLAPIQQTIPGAQGMPPVLEMDLPGVDALAGSFKAVAPENRAYFADKAKELIQGVQKQREGYTLGENQTRYVGSQAVATNTGRGVTDAAGEFALFRMGLPPNTKSSDLIKIPGAMEEFERLATTYRRAGAPGGTTINMPGQRAFDTGVMGDLAAQLMKDREGVVAGVQDDILIARAIAALRAGASSGPGTSAVLTAKQLAEKAFGVRSASAEQTNQLRQLIAQRVLVGTAQKPIPGPMSEYETKLVEFAKGGNIDASNPGALAGILENSAVANRQRREAFKATVARIPEGGEVTPEWKAYLQTIPGEENLPTASAPAPAPQTRARVQRDGRIPYKGKLYQPIMQADGTRVLDTPDGLVPVLQP